MARSPLAAVEAENPTLAGDIAADQASETVQSSKRSLGPKVVYIQLAPGTDKSMILSVHTNTRTLVDSMEQNAGSSYVKMTLPQGEPRGPKKG
jgi:hypothetical protein